MLRILFATALLASTVLFGFRRYQNQSQTTCVACETLTGVEKIVCLADAFKATLNSTQITTLQLSYSLSNAQKWSNLPVTFVSRLGLRLGDLNTTQLAAAQALIEAATGTTAPEGYAEVQQLWAADQYLSQNGGGSTYGNGQYYIAFLGTPSTTGKWELQTGGHHLAVANTYANGQLVGATPSFRAVEPFAAFASGTATYQPMIQERDSLAAILASLSSSELAAAKVTTVFNDILLGPNKDWQFPATKIGIKASTLSTEQKKRILAAIRTYVEDIDAENAAAYMALYTGQMDDTYIAYSGTAALTQQKDYIRIDGPRVWIEYSTQGGIVLSPNHPHSVWRDHQTDYGGTGNPAVSTTSKAAFNGTFTLAPNPGSSQLQAQIELDYSARIQISLRDVQGRALVNDILAQVTPGQHVFPVDTRQLPSGTYQCTLEVKQSDGSLQYATRQWVKI